VKNKIVLDSCVFSKLFLKEHDSHQANALINALIKNKTQILVPSLFKYEVLATATVANYSVEDIYKLIIGFQKSILQTIELDDISLKLIDDICKAGHEKSGFPSFYDASYHALSIQYNCYFVTADKRHFTKTQQLGHILLLSDWEKIL